MNIARSVSNRNLTRVIVRMVALAAFCGALAIGAAAQTLTTLASFAGSNGANPQAALVQGRDGNFYGTTVFGGSGRSQTCNSPTTGCGTVFKITPSGTLTTIYSFCSAQNCSDGFFPASALVQGTDGSLYGTTSGNTLVNCGTTSCGTVFRISNGTLTTIYRFCSRTSCSDGNWPAGGLIQANDGTFYGTTVRGGTGSACPPQQYPYGCGTLFKMTPNGTVTTLYNFCTQSNCADGNFPQAALVQGADGAFYGTTESGGTSCTGTNPTCGTVFKITAGGSFTSLYSFAPGGPSNPVGALVQGTDGNLYGTTAGAATAVFSITSSGMLNFIQPISGTGPSNAGLTQAGDGNFYGTTVGGGGNGGTIFKVSPTGMLTTVYVFSGPDGNQPQATTIQAMDGQLYGTTYGGGANNNGTVFRITGPTPSAGQFVTVPPCRLADTRKSSPIQGGTSQVFNVPLLALMNPNCGFAVPSNAIAYSLNVTVVPPHQNQLHFLTIWPAGRAQPYVSTMNSQDGRTKANAAIVPAGAANAVSVYVTDTTDVVLDINGYFVPSVSQTLKFIPLPPCRVVDTRDATKPQGLGPPFLGAMETRSLPILSSPCFQGLAVQPQVYSFNVTVTPNPGNQPLYFLALWPSGPLPTVSTLNNGTAAGAVANAAIVPADTNGNINVYASNSTDVVIDVNGYFGTPGEYSYYATAPCRAFDSRNNNGQPFKNEIMVPIAGSPCAPSSTAKAYVFNATVVPQGTLGFLTLWPDGENQPLVSTLNAYDGLVTSNMAVVPNLDGITDAYATNYTHLVLDLLGYFAP